MSDPDDSLDESVPVDVLREINRLCVGFEKAWRDGKSPRLEDFASSMSGAPHVAALRELIAQEVDLRREAGQSAEPKEYHARFPQHAQAVNGAFSLLDSQPRLARQVADTDLFLSEDVSEKDHSRQHACAKPGEPPDPRHLGRFEIESRLGRGAFGDVYLAYDPQLQRRVAMKVPRCERFSSIEDMDIFVQEARTAAGLTHPGIVTIHDVVRDGDLLFIVQEYVEGQDLAKYLMTQNAVLSAEQVVGLLLSIAEGLLFAHQKGFVHRDLKSANILMDAQLRPRIADFGLAVHETAQRRRRGEQSGTPAYMSPEQVRGETHRLDGRSDIWSLGVILYELLTGRRPFHGDTRDELFDEIKHRDPTPPRQRRQQVPAELERICLKCLSKRVTDRYSSAADLIDDLRHWSVPRGSALPSPASVRIVPKGLRSFDAGDADFFLKLVPGPRDRNGLPESIRFWKTRLEETDADHTFAVGLVYGPSGCGKSSLVKAGLLPHLASHILPIYVEATPADTEVRMLKGLRKMCPAIPEGAPLPEVYESLREGIWLPAGRKVVLVLDQFEQWLHAHRAEEDTQLVTALRHCDGGRLQAILMVRDDFAMAASRIMRDLDTRIVEGHNFATVDLFNVAHAASVLTKFGQAFGRLPGNAGELSVDEQSFVTEVAHGLAQDGKVVSVRLALFAEMVKNKPWTPGTLVEVGGTQGIGVNFLEETFSSREANPDHKLHAAAARGVLRALLPELDTDIKGGMRSQHELREVSGYKNRPADFADLLRILDSELRLITPTDPEGVQSEDGERQGDSPPTPSQCYYQLTQVSAERWKNLKEQTETAADAMQNNLGPSVPFNLEKLRALPEQLVVPELQTRFTSTTNSRHKLSLSFALAAYGELDALYLVPRIDDIAEADTGNYVTALQANSTDALATLKAEALKCSHQSLWRRKARLAIAALGLGDTELARDVCAYESRPDPGQRTLFIDELPKWDIDLKTVHVTVKNNSNPALRSGICLGIGQIPVEKILDPGKELWQSLASQWFVQQGDPSSHSASAWLLRNWNAPIPETPEPHEITPQRDWYVMKTSGATMLRIRPEAPAPAAVLADPVEKYRQQLDELATVAAADLEKSEIRMARAIAHFQVGNLDHALEDLNLLQEKEDSEAFSTVLMYRTLTLARMGKADAARESLDRYLEQEVRVSYRSYMKIQVSAWLGDIPEAWRQLESAASDASADQTTLYNLACAAARCAQATSGNDAQQSQRFANRAIELLKGTVSRGYHKAREAREDPDFVSLQSNARFVSILAEMDGAGTSRKVHEFWVADREVTRGQFEEFMNDANYAATEKPAGWDGVDESTSPTADHPAQNVSWCDALQYCNWLSLRERLIACYERTGTKEHGRDEEEDNAWRLIPAATGYRLLHEAEWEYVCRAGTSTQYSMGNDEGLLAAYCQMYPSELTATCGEKLPNAWGLHDVHGNVWEWCWDKNDEGSSHRVLRGGSFNNRTSNARSAIRSINQPAYRNYTNGFRVGRTLPTVPFTALPPAEGRPKSEN